MVKASTSRENLASRKKSLGREGGLQPGDIYHRVRRIYPRYPEISEQEVIYTTAGELRSASRKERSESRISDQQDDPPEPKPAAITKESRAVTAAIQFKE